MKYNNIFHITSVHSAFDVRIFHKECKTLSENGYDVTIIAQHDKDETIERIKIIALPKVKNRLERFLILNVIAFWKVLKQRADVYHLHDPELIFLGFILRLLGGKVVYDVHEDVPRQIFSKYWIPKIFRSIVSRLIELTEYFSAQVFNGIVCATPQIARRFPSTKTVLIQNFPMKDELSTEKGYPYELRPPLVGYIGGISGIRGIFEIIKAIDLIPDEFNIRLVLAGIFDPPEIENEVRLLQGWKKVEFLGWISRRIVKEILEKIRLGLVLFHPVPNHINSWPNKLFEYISAGIPVVASNFPLWIEIIKENDCGICVDPRSPDEIATAIEYLVTHPEEAKRKGENGRKAVLEKYNWENEAKKLINFYKMILEV